jgi:hypothetical protein
MAKMGRPRKDIDWKQFEELCKIQCTEEEICSVLGVCVDTLNLRCEEQYGEGNTFSKVFEQKRKDGKSSLRRAQWKSAIEGNNTAMQIFLGKNMLGQADKQEIDQNTSGSIEVVFSSDLEKWSK